MAQNAAPSAEGTAGSTAAPEAERSDIPKKPKPRPLSDLIAADDEDQDETDEDIDGATGSSSRGQLAIYAYRAPLVRAVSIPPPDPEKTAFDPDMFAQNPPYVFRAQISNDQEDAYSTRMHATSLRNYAADAEEGVSLQNSHRSNELPMGRSYRGRYSSAGTQPDQIAKTHADFYVVPGTKLNEVHSDDLIRGIRSGVVRDVSVGFYGGTYRCTICDRNMLLDMSECEHVPGLTYRVKRAHDGEMEEKKAAAWVHDARLAEVSTVYDGATPGAAIMKAQCMAESGRLNPIQARWLETQYRIKLYGSQRYFAVPALKESRMTDPLPVTHAAEQGLPVVTDPAQGFSSPGADPPTLAQVLAEAGLTTGGDPLETVRALIRDRTGLTHPTVKEEPPPEERAVPPVVDRDIDDARAYRAKVIAEAASEVIRAFSNEADLEFHTRRWNALPIAEVIRERDHYALLAKTRFPGGRMSVDHAPPPGTGPTVPPVPDFVYSSGSGFAAGGRKE